MNPLSRVIQRILRELRDEPELLPYAGRLTVDERAIDDGTPETGETRHLPQWEAEQDGWRVLWTSDDK